MIAGVVEVAIGDNMRLLCIVGILAMLILVWAIHAIEEGL